MISRAIVVFFLLFSTHLSFATKYWLFVDKSVSLQDYRDHLRNQNITPLKSSNWFHAISVDKPISELKKLTQIDSITLVHSFTTLKSSKADDRIIDALKQLNHQAFLDAGLNGQGIKIGITDAGFVDADSSQYFTSIFNENRVIAYKDFVNPYRDDFYNKENKGDSHGFQVFKRIGGKIDSIHYGFAPKAEYYLARTENTSEETRIEEDNWVAAIEWLDSLGVRLVNTSLGYSHLFDAPEDNYLPNQMNGKTALITKAAQIAVSERNMIIVVSAGNEGRRSWKIISAPADAQGVISVGATNFPVFSKASYSSIGPEYNPYLKPDISCYSPNGTSYSAPIITGLVACILQYDSSLSLATIKEILFNSSHLHPSPNNFLGYGVPDCDLIIKQLKGESIAQEPLQVIVSENDKLKIELDSLPENHLVLFYKSSEVHVTKQNVLGRKKVKKKKRFDRSKIKSKGNNSLILKLYRYQNCQQTSIVNGNKLIEVIWKN